MTDRHDEWTPEDDELVRQALMSLMDDVSCDPLPEPAQIRERAEQSGRSGVGTVTELGPRRRRRSMAVLAGAAAAALVTAGAALIVVNQSPGSTTATSSSDGDRSSEATTRSIGGPTAAASRLRVLGPAEWQAVLGIPVEATEEGEPEDHCFQPAKDTTWESRSARQSDGTRVAGQWVGTSPDGTKPLIRTVNQSVSDCEGYAQDVSIGDDLASDGSFRAWHHTRDEGSDVWWVEVTDGSSASFLSVPEPDGRSYDDDDIRTLARGVLGELDLTRPSSTSTTSSSGTSTGSGSTTSPGATEPGEGGTSTTTSPRSTSDPTTTSPEGSPTSGGGSGSPEPGDSSTSGPSRPSDDTDPSSTTSPTVPDPAVPAIGDPPPSTYLPPSRWSSETLTGGAPAVSGPLELEGGPMTIGPCASTAGASKVSGIGIRSGEGDDNYFGRQYVLQTSSSDNADQLESRLVEGYSGDCGGGASARPIGGNTFAMTQGDLTTYVVVVRQNSTTVSVLQVNTAKTAPRPLTDASASQELGRLARLVRG